MSGKTSFETRLPEGVKVYSLVSPLTFVGLPRFVSALIEGGVAKTRVVIMNVETDALAVESDLTAVDSAADRLFEHAIIPLLVVPEGRNQVSRYFKRTTNIATFRSMQAALNCAKSFVAADVLAEKKESS